MKILRDFSRSLAPDTPQSNNPAKQVASFLHGMLPVIYGAGFLSSVARRWKTQLNENSKVWAFAEVLPELDHNAAQGLALPSEVTKKAAVVLLHSSLLHSRLSFRYRVTQELLAQEGVRHHRIEATGWSPLAHLLGTVMLGDFVSYYLAMLNHVDPAATPALDWVKEQISRA